MPKQRTAPGDAERECIGSRRCRNGHCRIRRITKKHCSDHLQVVIKHPLTNDSMAEAKYLPMSPTNAANLRFRPSAAPFAAPATDRASPMDRSGYGHNAE